MQVIEYLKKKLSENIVEGKQYQGTVMFVEFSQCFYVFRSTCFHQCY